MTNDALKAAAGKASLSICDFWLNLKTDKYKGTTVADLILRELQPFIDADQQRIERFEKALRWYADPNNYDDTGAPITTERVTIPAPVEWEKSGIREFEVKEETDDFGNIARQALGEED